MAVKFRPIQWIKQTKWTLALPMAVLAVASLIALNELGYQRSIVSAENMSLQQEKRGELNSLLQNMLDAETGQRGYLLTGDQTYLGSYGEALAQIAPALDKLRDLYINDRGQLGQFAELSGSMSKKLAELEVTVKLRQLGGESENWMQVVRTDIGRGYMDAVRDKGNALIAAASVDIAVSRMRIDQSLTISRVGVTLAALLGLLAFHLYLRQTQKLNAAGETQRVMLAKERDTLGELVRERTERLSELANHLQVVQEEERERLARELHDELGALLTAAKFDVARIKSKLPADTPELSNRLAHLNESLNAGISLKRRIVEDLRPSSLSNLGLEAALEILTSEFTERTGVQVKTDIEAINVGPDADLTVYRTVQESLTNIAKYADAKEVVVSLHGYVHHIEVSVEDNGRGFDLDTRQNASHGLPGMRHRIEALNGTLQVSSAPGQGARVHAVFPRPKPVVARVENIISDGLANAGIVDPAPSTRGP